MSWVQRSVSKANGALQNRDRNKFRNCSGPGSAVHHLASLVLRRVRGTDLVQSWTLEEFRPVR